MPCPMHSRTVRKKMTEQPAKACADMIRDRDFRVSVVGDASTSLGVSALVEKLVGTVPVCIHRCRAGWLVLLTADETSAGMPKLFIATEDMTVRCLPAGVPTARAAEASFEWVCSQAELLTRVANV